MPVRYLFTKDQTPEEQFSCWRKSNEPSLALSQTGWNGSVNQELHCGGGGLKPERETCRESKRDINSGSTTWSGQLFVDLLTYMLWEIWQANLWQLRVAILEYTESGHERWTDIGWLLASLNIMPRLLFSPHCNQDNYNVRTCDLWLHVGLNISRNPGWRSQL